MSDSLIDVTHLRYFCFASVTVQIRMETEKVRPVGK
jgi:hypothetical protein